MELRRSFKLFNAFAYALEKKQNMSNLILEPDKPGPDTCRQKVLISSSKNGMGNVLDTYLEGLGLSEEEQINRIQFALEQNAKERQA